MAKGRPSFEDLEIYHLAERRGDEVWRAVSRWQRLAQNTVGGQMIRSADAVAANIAEGAGRITCRDNRRFAGMARGSPYETIHWLRRACTRGLLGQDEMNCLSALTTDLAPRLNAYIKALSKRCVQAPDEPGVAGDG